MTSFTSKTRLTEGKLQRGLSISNLCALLLRCSERKSSCSSHQNPAVAEPFPIGTLQIRTSAAFPASAADSVVTYRDEHM